MALNITGTYTLVLAGSLSNTLGPATYSFRVDFNSNTPPAAITSTALALGSAVNSTVGASGTNSYEFTLNFASQLWFDSQANDYSLTWDLTDLQGNVINPGNNFAADDQNLGVVPAGSYLLRVSGPAGENVGFNLLNSSATTPLTPGTTVSGTLNEPLR